MLASAPWKMFLEDNEDLVDVDRGMSPSCPADFTTWTGDVFDIGDKSMVVLKTGMMCCDQPTRLSFSGAALW
jgi:hypothetical protein